MENLITKLFQTPKTIFTSKDLALFWAINNKDNLKSKISYYAKRGGLIRLTRGVFAKDKNYNPKELVNIYTPSYVSFETALREAGIIFQHGNEIFAAGPISRTIIVDNNKVVFRKIKQEALFNKAGIKNKENYSIAEKERAFLDMIYLFPDFYFDNLRAIDWGRCFDLVKIYRNKALDGRLKKYQKQYAQQRKTPIANDRNFKRDIC